jgi:Leucine-rich repeat (LRR) protein
VLEVHKNSCKVAFTDWIDWTATHLTTLNVEFKCNTLPPEMGAFTNLTELSFIDKGLNSLTPVLGQLTALVCLKINCSLEAVPREIGLLTRLATLDLSSNAIATLPEEIGLLTNLTALKMERNPLESLPRSFACLTALESLRLAGSLKWGMSVKEMRREDQKEETRRSKEADTKLEAANSEMVADDDEDCTYLMYRLPRLRSLDLYYCGITRLPPEISLLTNLTTLNLAKNELTELPPELGCLHRLRELNLNANKLVSFPREVGRLMSLATLHFNYNNITCLPVEMSLLTSLSEISVHKNPWSKWCWMSTLPAEPNYYNFRIFEMDTVLIYLRNLLSCRKMLIFFASPDWFMLYDLKGVIMEMLASFCLNEMHVCGWMKKSFSQRRY